MTSIVLNTNKLFRTFLPAVAIMAGVMFKNGGEQYAKATNTDNSQNMKIGMGLFVGGWLAMAFVLGGNKLQLSLPVVSSMGVLLAVMIMMCAKHNKQEMPKWAVYMFTASWVALGYSVGLGRNNTAKMLGLGASASVLASMLYTLPEQRKHNVVDGPGMALFALGWVFLSMANAM
jgi:hypothetical protein